MGKNNDEAANATASQGNTPAWLKEYCEAEYPADAPRCIVCGCKFSAQEAKAGYRTCERCPDPDPAPVARVA